MPRNHRGGDRRRGAEPRGGERPGRAERADRTEVFGKTKLCKFHILGVCSKGEGECNFAHDSTEMNTLPDLSRTKICKTLINTGKCEEPDCKYAHSREELRNMPGGGTDFDLSKAAAAQCRAPPAPSAVAPAPCAATAASNAAFAQAFAAMAAQELQGSHGQAGSMPQLQAPFAQAAANPQAQAALLQHMAAQLSLQAAMIQAQQPGTCAPDRAAQMQMAMMHAASPGWPFPAPGPSAQQPPPRPQQPAGNSAFNALQSQPSRGANGGRDAVGRTGAGGARGGRSGRTGGGSSLAWPEEQRGEGRGPRVSPAAAPPARGRVARSAPGDLVQPPLGGQSALLAQTTASAFDPRTATGSSVSPGPLFLDHSCTGGIAVAASPAAAAGGSRRGRAGRMAVVDEAKRTTDRFDSDDSTAVPASERRLQDCASVETTPQDTPTLGPSQLPAAVPSSGMGGDSLHFPDPHGWPATPDSLHFPVAASAHARPRTQSGSVMDDADFRASLGLQSVTVKNTFLDFQSHQPSPRMPGMRQVQTAAGRLDLMAQIHDEDDDEQ